MMRWYKWLLVAALAGWLIERTLARAAIFMPKTGAMVNVAQAITFVGQVAFNLTAILTLAAIVWLAARGLGRAERRLSLSIPLAGLVGLSVAGVFTAPGPWELLLFHVLTLAVLAVLVFDGVRAHPGIGSRLAIVVPAIAIAAATLFKIDQTAGQLALRSEAPTLALTAFQVGELFVVLAPLAAWWAWGRSGRARDWVVAALPAALFAVAYAANASMTATLAMWSIGLSLYLPWPVYAISLWLATLTAVRAVRVGRPAGYGLALLASAGFAMQLSSQVMLALIGIWLLGLPRLPDDPDRQPAPGSSESAPVAA